MTDYRDPNYRNPNNPNDPGPDFGPGARSWSNATWGWIAGIAVVVLVLILVFGSGGDTTRTANDAANPPSTTGQRMAPPAAPATPAPVPSAR
jgi:hypothetical protein